MRDHINFPIHILTLLVGAYLLGTPASAHSATPDRKKLGARRSHSVNLSDVRRSRSSLDSGSDSDISDSSPLGHIEIPVKGGRTYPPPELERVGLTSKQAGRIILDHKPRFATAFAGKVAGITNKNEFIFYTLDVKLQAFAERLVREAKAAHVSIVAMNPKDGKILAIAEKSNSIKNLSLHAGFPAASVFKLVTTTAALEKSPISPYSSIRFRGGNYTLDRWNFTPDPKRDRRAMILAEALGRSCNIVFARVALKYLNPRILSQYSDLFGFNRNLEFDLSLPISSASIPSGDSYELGRTAAGFGDVHMSPIHAAALMAGIANGGQLPRPALVDHVVDQEGRTQYRLVPETLTRIMDPTTSKKVLRMMEFTTTVGTSKNEFYSKGRKRLTDYTVAAKTGTLAGDSPEGINHWFVAAAPIEAPTIAVSVIVVNPGGRVTKSSRLGRQMIEKYLHG